MSAVTTTSPGGQIATLKQALCQMPFQDSLPSGISVEAFRNSVVTAVNLNPDLLNADRTSLLTSCMKAAQDGLLPDNTEGALVPYGGKVTWLPMVQGVIKRLMETEGVAAVRCREVYVNDEFAYVLGEKEYIEHKQTMGPRGDLICVYAIISFTDPLREPVREVMRKEDIEACRQAGKAADGVPWKKWYGEMARKSVLHRAAKWVPKSTRTSEFLKRQFDEETGEVIELTATASSHTPEPSTAPATVKKLSKLDKFESMPLTAEPVIESGEI